MPPAAPSAALRTDEEMTPVTPAFTSRRAPASPPAAHRATAPATPDGVLALPERLDTRAAPALAETLRTRAGGAELVLDASAVRFVGALCAQVLLAAAGRRDGPALVFAAPSEAFTAGLARLGVDALLSPAGRAAP